jgi:UDP-N-acetylmuramoyl-tripeptide--D-alanyl-D-alanine ligase
VIEGKSEMYPEFKKLTINLFFVNVDDAIQVRKSHDMKMYSFAVNNAKQI